MLKKRKRLAIGAFICFARSLGLRPPVSMLLSSAVDFRYFLGIHIYHCLENLRKDELYKPILDKEVL